MPYATIVLPTHERASTLAMAIQSALAQSVADVEVIVIGDGCTPQVRDVATGWSLRDSRVRFLDLEKGEGNGHVHRDAVVRTAASERVFFIDDDDLYLPHHVETLGRIIDGGADVADTPAVSVSPVGRADFGLHDFGDADCRTLYADNRYKPIFDTHLAVTRAAYQASVVPPHARPMQIQFPAMLSDLARAPEVKWRTIKRITALSLHGARRSTWTEDERRDELAAWFARLDDPDLEARLRADGSLVMHATDLVNALRASGADPEACVGVTSRLALSAGFAADSLAVAACCALARLYDGVCPDIAPGVFGEVLRGRLDASVGPWSRAGGASFLIARGSPDFDARSLLQALATPDAWILLGQIEARRQGFVSAETLTALKALPERERFAAGIEMASTYLTILHDAEAAREWLSWARSRPAKPRHAAPFDQLAAELGVPALWD